MKIKATSHPQKKYKNIDYVVLFVLVMWICYLSCCFHHSFLYDDPDYVCRHMARDLERNLENIGLDTKIISNNKHMWISIYGFEIDSVTLLPIFVSRLDCIGGNRTVYNSYDESMARYNDKS